ncbi:Formamidopyrimidine-DNA glycosylase N-terminal domain-containing protein [Lineolata rhizophorae]|uniref:Formamidopyrimidine-DNA glycosylase N-terminal domain-containing protein n=1 Tax=Lineolata rhizophorae TaxID=578093 RepID=A0A6A6PAJ1_9PEZI|nr:Formamidopyrimidine-DNA glycosylase N-terminal domain-containing protein [Lineolata rhizophorae]
MPEISEVARIVHYLKKNLVGKTIKSVQVQEDEIIYGKAGTTASAFKTAMTGKTVVDARQQGKYFWLVMSKPPHPLMHFGMTGWIKLSNEDTTYYRPSKAEQEEAWPPRFWKFVLDFGDGQAAFVDKRRLGRIRLVDAKAEDMRKTTPLKENGPDPVIDKDILTLDWLSKKLRSKKVPIKALLLDQANISGIGNWVGDETLYQAKIHPEQYSNTLSDAQIKQLHLAIMHVCTSAVGVLGKKEDFPDGWLMKYLLGDEKKDKSRLPSGEKIIYLKVGGRTSAVVPSVQKKTGDVAGDFSEDEEEEEPKPKKAVNGTAAGKKGRKKKQVDEDEDDELFEESDEQPPAKKQKGNAKATKGKTSTAKPASEPGKAVEATGKRRSGRFKA